MTRTLKVMLAAALFAVLVPSAAAAHLPRVQSGTGKGFQVRPGVIAYTGDGSAIIGGLNGTSVRHLGALHWSTYNGTHGKALGLLWLNNCTPDCADGKFSSARVHVEAFAPRHGHFTRLTLRYTYRGHHRVDRLELKRFGKKFWGYNPA